MTTLSSKYKTGRKAEAALHDYVARHGAILSVSHLIRDLGQQGFVIAPRPKQRPARRGNEVPPTEPSPWIGKTHTQRLIGGAL